MADGKRGLQPFDNLVRVLEKLPTIGKKSARRMAYTLGVEDAHLGLQLAQSIQDCVESVCKCELCGGLSLGVRCSICHDPSRNNGTMCIVSHPKDIFLIEDMGEFGGVYCVVDDHQNFAYESLRSRIRTDGVSEIIFAFMPSLQSDVVMLFVQDKLSGLNLRFSKIAHGVPTNVSLENIDGLSLVRAFKSRVNA